MADATDLCGACGGRCCSFGMGLDIVYRRLRSSDLLIDLLRRTGDDLLLLKRRSGPFIDVSWTIRLAPDGRRHLAFACHHLERGRCSIYDDRPTFCRRFECKALRGLVPLGKFLEENREPEGCIHTDVTGDVKKHMEGLTRRSP